MLQVYQRELGTGFSTEGLICFRSRTSGTVSLDQLIKEVAANNTTCTEADTRAVIVNLKEIILKYLKKGMSVEAFMGTYSPSAKGSCLASDGEVDFDPTSESTNHDIRLLFRPNSQIAKSIRAETEVERVSGKFIIEPFIERVSNALTTKKVIQPGDSIICKGVYLKIDPEDPDQGLFLKGDAGTFKLDYLTRNADQTLEARIGTDVPSGQYTLTLHNARRKTPKVTTFEGKVDIA